MSYADLISISCREVNFLSKKSFVIIQKTFEKLIKIILEMLLGFVVLLNGVFSSEEKLLEYYREICWLSPKVRVETKNGLRGIFANEKIEDGELLMSSRKGCKICWEDALVEFPVLGYYVPLVSVEN